jgi:hypothetical protein
MIPELSSATDQECASTKSYVKSAVAVKYLIRSAEMATVLIILIIRRPDQEVLQGYDWKYIQKA